jgi:hypothetical protein
VPLQILRKLSQKFGFSRAFLIAALDLACSAGLASFVGSGGGAGKSASHSLNLMVPVCSEAVVSYATLDWLRHWGWTRMPLRGRRQRTLDLGGRLAVDENGSLPLHVKVAAGALQSATSTSRHPLDGHLDGCPTADTIDLPEPAVGHCCR